MNDKELEKRFGISRGEIEEVAAQFESGEWPEGTTTLLGRRPLYDESMKSVTYRDTASEVARMDERASSLGLNRSGYLRYLVRRDLDAAR